MLFLSIPNGLMSVSMCLFRLYKSVCVYARMEKERKEKNKCPDIEVILLIPSSIYTAMQNAQDTKKTRLRPHL